MKKTSKMQAKQYTGSNDMYIQVHIPSADVVINEKADGFLGVITKSGQGTIETKAIVAVDLTPADISRAFVGIVEAITSALLKATPLDIDDIETFLQNSVLEGIEKVAVRELTQDNPELVNQLYQMKALFNLMKAGR